MNYYRIIGKLLVRFVNGVLVDSIRYSHLELRNFTSIQRRNLRKRGICSGPASFESRYV